MADYTDLNPAGIPNKDYFDIVVSDLNVNTDYNFQFRWQYQDKTYGDWSATKVIRTQAEATPGKPLFVSGELTSGTGFIRISWSGNDTTGAAMTGLKQVNVWIRGGSFGATPVKTAHFFTSPGVKTISVPFGEYYVKLQAETVLGTLSPFSDEQSIWVLKKPQEVTSVSGTWVKDDGTTKTDTLKMAFTFNPSLETSSNTNVNADYFLINLTANGKTKTFYAPVNKASSNQEYYLSASENKANFGLFASQFTITVQVRDVFGQTSDVVTQQSLLYVTPLDVPVITATADMLSYNVFWNSQDDKPLDQIYIYEDTGDGYVQVAQGSDNPIRVPTTNTLQRSVKAKFYDSNGADTAFSNVVVVTPNSPVTADNTGPDNVTSVTTSGGIDTSGYLGFNAYADISWPAVTGGGIRGYRIRFSNDNNVTYAYVDSPGEGTSYRLSGLAIGATYKIAVATYDEFNNTSSQYVAGADVTVSGNPSVSNYITGGPFEFGVGVGGVSTNKGLYFDNSNYWYINATNSARLKVGGSTSNYLYWDGSDFTIDGNINARQGSFTGNVTLSPGGSVQSFMDAPPVFTISAVTFTSNSATYTTSANHGYIVGDRVLVSKLEPAGYNGTFTITARTLNTFTVTNTTNTVLTDSSGSVIKATGTGFILSKDGITFNSSTVPNITTIDAATGKLTTSSATIGGWDVSASTISKNGITLNSNGNIIANNGAYYVGIRPQASAVDDIVLWAGQSSTGADANFRVEAGGKLYAFGATLTGDITISSGSTFDFIKAKAVVFRQDGLPTAIARGDIWIDTNDSNKMYVATGPGTGLTTDTPTAGVWALSQDSAAAAYAAAQAAAAAATADGKAVTANSRAQKLDSVTGNLIQGLTLTTAGSIYANKASYADTTTGWFLGWRDLGAGNFTPALNIGGTTAYMKWNGSGLEIKGTITGSSFTSTNFDAGNGVRIYSVGSLDRIELAAGGADKMAISANASGAVIFGPSSLANIAMTNGGSINLVANGPSTTGASVIFATTGAVVNSTGYSATQKSFRNIIASTTTLSDGAAATGYIEGDIYLVY